MNEYNLRMDQDMLNPIVFAARNSTDTLYYHQATKATDANDFQKAIF